MLNMKTLVPAIAAAALVACGGGGGSGASTALTGKVIDGYITGAKVCLDVNSNLICDAGEPSTVTTAGGNYSLSYSGSLDGLRILAVVEPGPGVIDEDLGLIEKGFNLLTPAEAPSVLTPLTTMVAIEMSSKGMTSDEATASIKTALNLQATNLLGYDFKAAAVSGADQETLKIAQVAVSALAAVQEELKNDPTTADSLSSGERFKAAVKQVQTTILPTVMKTDGTLNIDIQGKSQSQLSALVKSESNLVNVISGQIQQIVANTKAGDGTRADFAQVFKDGLVLAEIRNGDYINKQGVRVDGNWGGYQERLTVESVQFDVATLTAPPVRNEWVSLIVGGVQDWYRTFDDVTTKYTFSGSEWIKSEKNGIFENKPTISGNCLLSPITPGSNDGEKFCAVAKNVSGQKIKDYVPNICQNNSGGLISGCNVDGVFPENSIGYDINVTATKDLYSIEAGTWSGYSYANGVPTVENFLESLTQYPQWVGSGCSIGFMVTDFDGKSGKMKWGENRNNSCGDAVVTKYSENTSFSIEQIGGKSIVKAMLPNVYRKRNPGDGGIYKLFGVFPMMGASNVNGIYSGDLMLKDATISIPFGNVDANTQVANRTLFNAVLPYINVQKAFPF